MLKIIMAMDDAIFEMFKMLFVPDESMISMSQESAISFLIMALLIILFSIILVLLNWYSYKRSL